MLISYQTCIKELRERVANGGDPSKLHEPTTEHDAPNCEPGAVEAMNSEGPDVHSEEPLLKSHDAGDIQEDMFDEIYKKATEETCQSSGAAEVLPDLSSVKESPNQVPDNGGNNSSEVQITEDQKARMVANRLKALERAAARARSSQAT
ncbi:hypothetical protein HHK36_024117 [Tetracentron sinense]|uniref:Uncharacterized protein n=1 Tax=Tetracentron sinense TaxID=13715 RepID=A0A835D3U8_TETSI|nr:hypothetical protein HHK36_024117 [Tetracentron sinense]